MSVCWGLGCSAAGRLPVNPVPSGSLVRHGALGPGGAVSPQRELCLRPSAGERGNTQALAKKQRARAWRDGGKLRAGEGHRDVPVAVTVKGGSQRGEQTERVAPVDFRGLRALPSLLDKPLLLGLVVSQDRVNVGPLPADERLWSVPAPALLAGA